MKIAIISDMQIGAPVDPAITELIRKSMAAPDSQTTFGMLGDYPARPKTRTLQYTVTVNCSCGGKMTCAPGPFQKSVTRAFADSHMGRGHRTSWSRK